MPIQTLRSRVLFAFGLLAIAAGSVDPLEGAPLVVVGTAAVTLAAYLARSRHLAMFWWSLPLTVIGVIALFALSSVGGVGGRTGRPIWWSIVVLPYAIGWIVTVTGLVLTTIESMRRPSSPAR